MTPDNQTQYRQLSARLADVSAKLADPTGRKDFLALCEEYDQLMQQLDQLNPRGENMTTTKNANLWNLQSKIALLEQEIERNTLCRYADAACRNTEGANYYKDIATALKMQLSEARKLHKEQSCKQ